MALNRFAVLAVFLVLGPGPAIAQSPDGPPPGRMHASSYGPIPGGMPIAVRPWDNTAANLRLKSKFVEALNQRGIKMAETGTPLNLNFETEVESVAVPEHVPTLGQVQARNHESRVRLNFWSTTQDSVTQGRRSHEIGNSSVRYILRATLDDPRSGQRLWQGQTTYDLTSGDETTTFALMVPVLLDGLGQTVRPKSFRVE